nr:hypothetical protein [Armatimonas sp.]
MPFHDITAAIAAMTAEDEADTLRIQRSEREAESTARRARQRGH